MKRPPRGAKRDGKGTSRRKKSRPASNGHTRFEGVFAPLRDPARFAELRVHPEMGTICWPGGVDLDPDALYARATGKPIDVSHPG